MKLNEYLSGFTQININKKQKEKSYQEQIVLQVNRIPEYEKKVEFIKERIEKHNSFIQQLKNILDEIKDKKKGL